MQTIASTYFDGSEWCPVVVKVRDGRPIKIEGNDLSRLTGGGTSARVQASVLSLYDNARYRGPLRDGKQVSWQDADQAVMTGLEKIAKEGKKIVILGPTVISPAFREVLNRFTKKYPTAQYLVFDHSPAAGMLLANDACFGLKALPSYLFENASVILNFGADFLGTWLMPTEFTRRYVQRRNPDGTRAMSWHVQMESGFSITGANADKRYPILPSDEKTILLALWQQLSGREVTVKPPVDLSELITRLEAARGESLVLSGSADTENQILVNAINVLLGNYGNTLSFNPAMLVRQGTDEEMNGLIQDLNQGNVGALLIHGVNPAFLWPDRKGFADAVKKAELVVSLSGTPDETSVMAGIVCPDHHLLESWGDHEPYSGIVSLSQPVIHPLGDTRQAADSLLRWAGEQTNFHDLISEIWSGVTDWTAFLQRGILEGEAKGTAAPAMKSEAQAILEKIRPEDVQDGGLTVSFYENVGLSSGSQSNNPWLQELPDPVSTVTWDNYAACSPQWAESQGLVTGDVILLGGQVELPVYVQPGQAAGSISVALHYGRTVAGKVAQGVGADIHPFIPLRNGVRSTWVSGIKWEKTAKKHEFAASQTHFNMEGRPIVRETSLEEYKQNPSSGNEMHEEFEAHHQTLYPEVKFPGYNWGMAIDLNSCTGCSACVIACQSENNVAVVGKEQVKKRRIMHWIRIDRYYRGAPENPEVVYQPVMCQHCDNAPCENVCPVSATNHSQDGLNQMAYNRCIGTRYCINNCPYKVRRFNWFRYVDNKAFDFNQNSDLGRMALNPDVTVRERGVVEKCSLCIQRIQEKKLQAKLENRVVADGEIQTACMQVCPSKAIVFGDLNNPDSKVSKMYQVKRHYHLLEDLHTLPTVGYMTLVRNSKA
ncbi:MAG: 4Fe-4S dicluster domain-containing protein [Bacteroidales bacterium]